jgi:hypothetical protein
MTISLSKSEVQTILSVIESNIQCEMDSTKCYPHDAHIFEAAIRDWQLIRRKRRVALKKVGK